MRDTPIILPYFSGAGHTAKLAGAIADGCTLPALALNIETLDQNGWAMLDGAEAIVFGTPTFMGSTAARFDAFLEDASERWTTFGWGDKIAAGFTVATHGSGDKLQALTRLSVYAAQMGMIWVGQAEIGAPVNPRAEGINADGSWLGLMATSSRDKTQLIPPGDLETARRFGARISGAVTRWRL